MRGEAATMSRAPGCWDRAAAHSERSLDELLNADVQALTRTWARGGRDSSRRGTDGPITRRVACRVACRVAGRWHVPPLARLILRAGNG